jgi:NAD(P)H dehydrogenase (quinone)
MKIAITAASGGLASAIIKQLVKQIPLENVVGLARTPEKAQSIGVEIRMGDYSDKSELIKSLSEIDMLLLVSGMDSPDKRIKQHRNVIDAAKEAGVKKIVYTSIFGQIGDTTFSPIIASNRQTEEDIKSSGLQWAIGRNGLYIEPDVNYIETCKKDGKIANCAADGKCSYTTRDELAYAYTQMLLEDKHNGKLYTLSGEPISQQQLTDYLNHAFNTNLIYEAISVEEYTKQRQAELGDFMGTIIAGIYQGIRNGSSNVVSDYKEAAGKDHISWDDYFNQIKKEQK